MIFSKLKHILYVTVFCFLLNNTFGIAEGSNKKSQKTSSHDQSSTIDLNHSSFLNLPLDIIYTILNSLELKDLTMLSGANFQYFELIKNHSLSIEKIFIDRKSPKGIHVNDASYYERFSQPSLNLELRKVEDFSYKTLENYLQNYTPQGKNRVTLYSANLVAKELNISKNFKVYLSNLYFIAKFFPNLESLTFHNFEISSFKPFILMKNFKKLHIVDVNYNTDFCNLPTHIELIKIENFKIQNYDDGSIIDVLEDGFNVDIVNFKNDLINKKEKIKLKDFILSGISILDENGDSLLNQQFKENFLDQIKELKKQIPEINFFIDFEKINQNDFQTKN